MADKKKVLLVEDDTFLVKALNAKLSTSAFELLKAKTGDEALKIITSDKPDLVLLDIMMPGKNGFEVLDEIKKNDETKDIPVIMLTNLGQSSDQEKAEKMGASDYLVKSDTPLGDILEKINKILG